MMESTAALKDALGTCSLDRLRSLYREVRSLVKATLVTDADMDTDCVAARKKMEVHLLEDLIVERLNPTYRLKIFKRIKSMGGMMITCVEGKGANAFVYTCGLTAVGGKELLMQNVHRSMTSQFSFNYMFKRHNEGQPSTR
jgi:hypothetical protein